MDISSFVSQSSGTVTDAKIDGIQSKLKGKHSESKAQELGREFESVFTSLLIKQMRSSMTENGLFEGDGSDTFGGMFDMYMGQHISAQSNLGIGDMISDYLAQKGLDTYAKAETITQTTDQSNLSEDSQPTKITE